MEVGSRGLGGTAAFCRAQAGWPEGRGAWIGGGLADGLDVGARGAAGKREEARRGGWIVEPLSTPEGVGAAERGAGGRGTGPRSSRTPDSLGLVLAEVGRGTPVKDFKQENGMNHAVYWKHVSGGINSTKPVDFICTRI